MLPSLHIEPTSRCTLGCPRCARTVMLETFGKKALPIIDLNVVDFENFVDIELEEIMLCGVYGDPIYHRQFKELIKTCKRKAKKIKVTTNGGHRTQSWWQSTVELLDSFDEIIFSIDGTPENFTDYRVNGDWESTLIGLKECISGSVKTTWKYIPFSYNENNIESTRKLALDLGIDRFEISYGDRWEENDWLKPTNKNLIDNNKHSIKEDFKQNKKDIDIDPLCKDQKRHYVSASGYYMPCCYVGDHRFYYKSEWWENRKEYNIKNCKLSDQIKNFNIFYNNIEINKPEYCVFNCGKC